MTQTPLTPAAIMQLGFGFWSSKTLLTAVELGVFTELARGAKSLDALCKKLALHPRGARDFFDALVALKVLDRQDGAYSNMPEAAAFLDKAKPQYIGGFLELANARLYHFWGSLTEALRTGKPQNETKNGGDPFEKLYADPGDLAVFLKAMTGISLVSAKAIAQAFAWKKVNSFVDVGCAQGGLTAELATAHPHLRGIGFDLPPVGPIFESYCRERNVASRVTFQAGSFFEEPLPSADVIVMGHILHDWDLQQKKMLLAKAYKALSPGGTLLVYDAMIDDARRENVFGLMVSLTMLIETPGGFDYTGADCIGWLKEAGFADIRIEVLPGEHSLAIATKPAG